MNMQTGISLCMIVKDEARSLQRCLDAIRDVVDEIILVDTGSTDDTIDIARRYGAVIINAAWTGDFSTARNLSLAAATHPWILVLDADEVWMQTEYNLAEMKRLLSQTQDDVWGYWIHVTSLLGTSGEERVKDAVCRLFRNDPRIAFQGRIHEEVASSILSFAPWGVVDSRLEIIHYGYLEDVIVGKNKPERNMRLIRSALHESPDQPELLYAMAAEWFQQARYDEALRLLQPLLAQLTPECGYHSDLVLKTAYAWREHSHPERALAIVEEWRSVYADFPDLLELGAVLELDQGRDAAALEWLKQAKVAASTASRYTSVSGAGTYRSLTLEGMAYERLGCGQEAAAAYTAALTVQPGSLPAWQRLLLLAAATGRPHAIASAAMRISLPPVAWQALIPAALDAHRPEWLLRHVASLSAALRAQPLAAGLALALLGEDAAARAALQPWAAHAQHGLEAALALWALGHKQPGEPRGSAAAGSARGAAASPAARRRAREQAATPDAVRAAEALLCGAPASCASPAPQAVHAAAHALVRVGAWAAWLRLLQALPPGQAPALLAALSPAARCGLLRAPASVREGLLTLFGTPHGAQQPFSHEVPAMVLAGTLALLAGRRRNARDWAEWAQITAQQPAAFGSPATTIPPGLHTLLRLTSPGTAATEAYANQCRMLLVHL
ncbi:glycosyltransferase [Paenibacillus sp. F6_3S_P_1C]|uniref:Glycosyltransferase n=1 Tax=Paenibacillus vandeheii TaxID=3035917 RepID=A0ABT8J845_9BACL|nr:glycosyltransferase [Paenibacillus vandeheii]MDN4601241.1 glycosyltransferase [Paenibacillus vandeheii]